MTKGKILLLGTNLGDRWSNLDRCRMAIERNVGRIIQQSSVYETAAWGKTNQPDFLNQVVIIESQLSPALLLKTILQIEHDLGRKRIEKWGARIIDIDILYYNSEVTNLPELTIPHPEIANRMFTLLPLAEVAKDLIDPVSLLTVEEMLDRCSDHTQVSKAQSVV